MSIRVIALFLYTLGLSAYAWKSWFVSVCGLILLTAVIQHPDYVRNIGGIQGLNCWNILLLSTFLAWLNHRQGEGLEWDLPSGFALLMCGFFSVILLSALRLLMAGDPEFPFTYVVSEKMINSIKYVLPGLILFDACRTRTRMSIGLAVVLGWHLLLAIQVVRWMPPSYALAESVEMTRRASKIVSNEIGYNRVTLSMVLAGASWAILSAVPLFQKRLWQIGVLGLSGVTLLGQLLTGGRSGYAAWVGVGLVLCTLRWRKLLALFPIGIAIVIVALPGVRNRVFYGVGTEEGGIVSETSAYQQLSGRNIAWPLVIAKIGEAPIIGHGREAMVTSGVRDVLALEFEEDFGHPHNAYLQILMDNGLIGFALVMPLFLYIGLRSARTAADRSDPLVCAVGCACLAVVGSLLIASLGGQTFYPREGAVGIWATVGLMLRAWVQQQNSLETGEPLFEDDEWDSEEAGDIEPVDDDWLTV